MPRIPLPFHRRVGALATAFVVLLIPALAWAGGDGDFAASRDKGVLGLYLAAYGAGVMTALTPCVYPMIPIVIGVFGARDDGTSRGRAFALATSYVMGMALLYSVLGVLFALAGKQAGSLLANPWVVLPMVAMFLALALSMFGAFEIRVPMALQNRLSHVGGRGYAGAFAMGLVGGVVAAPCVGPFLGGLLFYITKTRDVVLGGSALFVYALGMGLLFWIVAVFTGSLPRSGRWMEWIKSIGGIGLLVVALYFLRPIVPALENVVVKDLRFLLGALGLVGAGIALGAVHLSFYDRWSIKLRKGLGVALAVTGAAGVWFWTLTSDRKLDWVHDEELAFAQARADGKAVMIDFAADWCSPCKKLEIVFAKPEVFTLLEERFVPLKYDVSNGTDADEAAQTKWAAETLPAVIFVDASGRELARVKDLVEAEEMVAVIERALAIAEELPAAPPAEEQSVAPAASDARALPWVERDAQSAFAAARAAGKGVMVDVSAEWCASCEELEATFAAAPVFQRLQAHYVPVKIDVTAGTAEDQALQSEYQASTLPTVIFYDADGKEEGRITKYLAPAEFLATLDSFAR